MKIIMKYQVNAADVNSKNIYDIGDDFRGTSKSGDEISFTNYYMQKNGKPFFGVSGEFHFSRMDDSRWEDELIKMKLCGINVIATYVFWIHHEEEEGVFDFSGRKNLRKFLQLCKKLGLYVILRVGPFDHGEVRNGGIPDWMYGQPFEVRKLSDGFLFYTRRLYTQIAKQAEGLFFKDNGPIVGVQIDNEYMHSSAPWEITTGVTDEWVFGGDEGETYMLRMRDLALECGLTPAFFTCTGWGGAITPDSMMPLWGGYAFRPWLFYSFKGEHPATEEYIYQDFHTNGVTCTNDFQPRYQPEDRPYACCEMGGGMSCCYYYRFQYPYKSVDAMANIKLASGCNFLGYYMFQGGSNPVGKHGTFMNEGQVPKISYDYQAALGEFGQVRESYRRLKSIHYFLNAFGETFCGLQTVLPEGASQIDPSDMETLRYAVRTDGKRGFLFINNYQDHRQMPDRKGESVSVKLKEETLEFVIDIAGDENAILPFHFDLDGIDLVQACAQPITKLETAEGNTYVFFVPDGMKGSFQFEEGASVNGGSKEFTCDENAEVSVFTVTKGDVSCRVLVLSREMANRMYRLENRLVFTEEALLEKDGSLILETRNAENTVCCYPADALADCKNVEREESENKILGVYHFAVEKRELSVETEQTAATRYQITIPEDFLEGCSDAVLQISYSGDIGHAFIDGKMINDNFANGAVWEIGLKDFADRLKGKKITIYITPLKKGAKVNVESAMAARREEVESLTGELHSAALCPVYQIPLE